MEHRDSDITFTRKTSSNRSSKVSPSRLRFLESAGGTSLRLGELSEDGVKIRVRVDASSGEHVWLPITLRPHVEIIKPQAYGATAGDIV